MKCLFLIFSIILDTDKTISALIPRLLTPRFSLGSDEVSATRTGFQESNEAHQRTAERSQAFEEELHNTRQVVDTLRAESATLKGQVSVSSDRQVSSPPFAL